jgi:hypothetical protein
MPESRSDLEMYNADGIIGEGQNMQSGKIEWSEMAVQGLHSCGRSNQEKRPRFIALQQEVVAKNLTKIETVTEIAMETVTFNVEVRLYKTLKHSKFNIIFLSFNNVLPLASHLLCQAVEPLRWDK